MIETYQEKENLVLPSPAPQNFATIGEIYDDGVSLIFDGEEEPSEKHYKTNAFVVFQKGDRVRIISDSGTYVVEYPVGNPRKTMTADSSTTADTADNANTANSATTATTAKTAETAETAKTAQTATTAQRLATRRTFSLTGDVTGSATFDGSGNCTIRVTGVRVACLKNGYSSSAGYNIYLYASSSSALQFKIGSNGRLYTLQNA